MQTTTTTVWLHRQLNESDCLANQRIYLAFISFDPPSLIRLWLCSNVHPASSQERTAHNHSLWWGHPSMQHGAQSWIGTVWSKFGTGWQSSYSKAGTWLDQSVSSQVWALDGITTAGVHQKQQTIKGTSWPPNSAWQAHSSLPKKTVCCLESNWLEVVMWCPAWQRGAEKERHTVSVWATLVMPETPT